MPNSDRRDQPPSTPNMRPEELTDWVYLAAMTAAEAHQGALADIDNSPLTEDQLARMPRVPNPQAIRQRMGLTQRAFSRQCQIALGTLRDGEQGVRRPDSAAKAYLRVIQANPDAVLEALGQTNRQPSDASPSSRSRATY